MARLSGPALEKACQDEITRLHAVYAKLRAEYDALCVENDALRIENMRLRVGATGAAV
jgi:regulator of replication initiation timing